MKPALAAWVAIIVAGSASAASPIYDSLEDYCLQSQVDTPANCACGQASADAIMSDAEQQMTLTMMVQGKPPPLDTMEAMNAFMEKVTQVTNGCGEAEQPGQ